MSFLTKALQAGSPADALKPELLGSIRIAVVGEPSVGKTALTEVGCLVSVMSLYRHAVIIQNRALVLVGPVEKQTRQP